MTCDRRYEAVLRNVEVIAVVEDMDKLRTCELRAWLIRRLLRLP